MKLIYFISIAILFFIGCSTTYKVTDFKSRKEFYNNFNAFMKDKDGEVTLRNDSALSFENGAEVKDDSLILFPSSLKETKKFNKSITISLNKIEEASVSGKRLRGIIGGIVIGGLTGIIAGSGILHGENSENTSGSITYGALAGGIIGGIVGYLIGWNYHYKFNP